MPEQKPKRETRIITVYDDGSIYVQELHEATTVAVAEDGPSDPTPPGDDIETPPKGPGNP